MCERCVCVCVRGGDSCPHAKAGSMLHTIARVWVRGSWRSNVLYSRGRRGPRARFPIQSPPFVIECSHLHEPSSGENVPGMHTHTHTHTHTHFFVSSPCGPSEQQIKVCVLLVLRVTFLSFIETQRRAFFFLFCDLERRAVTFHSRV